MYQYQPSLDELEYLSNYHIEDFKRPSVAADIVFFSILGRKEEQKATRAADNFRKLPEKKLKILLVRRGTYPCLGLWALPGGFCKEKEDVQETARRELWEETGISHAYFTLSGVFGEKGRDPRGWIISNTFLVLSDGEKCKLRAGSDAWRADWFEIFLTSRNIKNKVQQSQTEIETEYELKLLNEEEDFKLSAVLRVKKRFWEYHETCSYEIIENHGLAFDHARIITETILSLRRKAEEEQKIIFDLMPEKFTLTELQRAFELVLDKKLLTANFRRKIADYVIETEEMVDGAGHRPAKLFQRNLEAFYKVCQEHP